MEKDSEGRKVAWKRLREAEWSPSSLLSPISFSYQRRGGRRRERRKKVEEKEKERNPMINQGKAREGRTSHHVSIGAGASFTPSSSRKRERGKEWPRGGS